MAKTVEALGVAFNKIRTGRAHPSLLNGLTVDYYGVNTPLSQAASVTIEDSRTLAVSPYEKSLVPEIEKAIMKSELGLNPSTAGTVIRIPLPALTEETRRNYGKQARHEAEGSRIGIRNIRREANEELKKHLKSKEISEDEEKSNEKNIQTITDNHIKLVDEKIASKEKEIMTI